MKNFLFLFLSITVVTFLGCTQKDESDLNCTEPTVNLKSTTSKGLNSSQTPSALSALNANEYLITNRMRWEQDPEGATAFVLTYNLETQSPSSGTETVYAPDFTFSCGDRLMDGLARGFKPNQYIVSWASARELGALCPLFSELFFFDMPTGQVPTYQYTKRVEGLVLGDMEATTDGKYIAALDHSQEWANGGITTPNGGNTRLVLVNSRNRLF
jgi:hypothetical protein